MKLKPDQKSLPRLLAIKPATVYYSFLTVLCASQCSGLHSVTHLGKSKTAITCKIINVPTCPLISVVLCVCTWQNPPQSSLMGLLFRLFLVTGETPNCTAQKFLELCLLRCLFHKLPEQIKRSAGNCWEVSVFIL